jgi:hypothetical protein
MAARHRTPCSSVGLRRERARSRCLRWTPGAVRQASRHLTLRFPFPGFLGRRREREREPSNIMTTVPSKSTLTLSCGAARPAHSRAVVQHAQEPREVDEDRGRARGAGASGARGDARRVDARWPGPAADRRSGGGACSAPRRARGSTDRSPTRRRREHRRTAVSYSAAIATAPTSLRRFWARTYVARRCVPKGSSR